MLKLAPFLLKLALYCDGTVFIGSRRRRSDGRQTVPPRFRREQISVLFKETVMADDMA